MNSDIRFNDETLSAFMDGELAPADMAKVRAALMEDEELAGRLATLSQVDTLVKHQSRQADERPMPAAVLAMLAPAAAARPSAKILQGPWQRWRQPLALAASVAVVTTAVLIYFNRAPAGLPAMDSYIAQLDSVASGTVVAVDDETTWLSRFSFRNRQNQICRQYQLASATQHTENVACRVEGAWSLVATVALPVQAKEEFQPASAAAGLDMLLDGLMQGDALDLATETSLISNDWKDAL